MPRHREFTEEVHESLLFECWAGVIEMGDRPTEKFAQ